MKATTEHTALVTGGARGIGAAIAGELGQRGFQVSVDNTYLTGQTIIVDGGFTCQ